MSQGLFTQVAISRIMTSVGRLCAALVVLGIGGTSVTTVMAAEAIPAAVPAPAPVVAPAPVSNTSSNAVSSVSPGTPQAAGQGQIQLPALPAKAAGVPALPALAGAVPSQGSSVREGAIEDYQNKASGTIKEIAKKLEFSREDVTLRDLNDARQAVIKIDAIIELEKKLAELEKVKKEKEKKVSILPVSESSLLPSPPRPSLPVLSPLPTPVTAAPTPAPNPAPVKVAEPKAAEIEVSRVVGGAGIYRAVASVDGNEKVLRVGDKLSGGVTVTAVSSQGVEVMHKGEKKLYAVKDVGAVFGGAF